MRSWWRELIFSRREILVVVLTMALGFAGPSLCLLLQGSLEKFLQSQSRSMLNADVVLTSTRELQPNEIKAFNEQLQPLKSSEDIVVVTMAKSVLSRLPSDGKPAEARAGLVDLQAVDAHFPLIERWRVRTGDGLDGKLESVTGLDLVRPNAPGAHELPSVFVSPEALPILGVKFGDHVELGHQRFQIRGIVQTVGGMSRPSLSFAPKVYIAKDEFPSTGLAQFGSQLSYRISFLFVNESVATAKMQQLKRNLITPDIFVRTPEDATRGLERFSQFFLRYLGLLSLIVLVLALTCTFYLLQSWQQSRIKPIAIQISLGASQIACGIRLFLQSLGICLAAVFISIVCTWGMARGLEPFLQKTLSARLILQFSPASLGLLVSLSGLAAFGFVLPTLWRLRSLNLRELLSEGDAFQSSRTSWWQLFVLLMPLFLVGTIASYVLLEEWTWAAGFLVGFLGFLGLLWFALKVFLRGLYQIVKSKPGSARLILLSLVRSRLGMDLAILALALSVFVMNLLPPFILSVQHELAGSSRQDRPLFFLFNVQKPDLDRLGPWLSERQYQLKFASPLIQARLEGRNGKPFQDDVLLKFPVRVTTRDHLAPSETIVGGTFFKGPQPDMEKLEVSLEQQFAKRNSISLGDMLSFEIQGVELQAKVTSLRRVRWTEFHPNFFIQFPSGFLDDLPATYIASVLPVAGTRLAVGELQAQLIREFPDVSVIDVAATLNQVVELIESFRLPLLGLTWLSGFLSLILAQLILLHNLRAREFEFDLEKILGAAPDFLLRLKWAEYGVLILVASVVGWLASELAVRLVLSQVLQIQPITAWQTPVLVAVAVLFLSSVFVLQHLLRWIRRQSRAMNG